MATGLEARGEDHIDAGFFQRHGFVDCGGSANRDDTFSATGSQDFWRRNPKDKTQDGGGSFNQRGDLVVKISRRTRGPRRRIDAEFAVIGRKKIDHAIVRCLVDHIAAGVARGDP